MGCRVIFSCLSELAKNLDLPEQQSTKSSTRSSIESHKAANGDGGGGGGESAAGEPHHSIAGTIAAPIKRSSAMLLSGASTLGRGMYSLGGKIASPITGGGGGAKADAGEGGLLPRELKGLIGDVVLLGAPINPKVCS